ncbi:MAG: ATP-dependent helicase [Desulfobacterales bacterium]|nr:ATP-dependent helicase [Desulfobacterales bacterium]
MNLTEEQKNIITTDLNRGEILKVVAFAGTGKTTTLIQYAKYRPHLRFLYVAFNKSVQLEASSKFPSNVVCKTAHSLAWKDFGSKYKDKIIPNLKANNVVDVLDLPDYLSAQFTIDTLIRYLISSDDVISKRHIPMLAFECYSDKKKTVPNFVELANNLWKSMRDQTTSEIGMLHDGYLKLYQLSQPFLRFDYILLDEAQDINPVIKDIVLSQFCPRIIVGDPHQQIYSFRGASNIIQEIESDKTLYLTHSFRFGNQIASVANQILNTFKNERNKLVGLKGEGTIGTIPENYTTIARTNASIFDEAASLYKNKKIAFIGGVEGYRFDEIVDTYYLYSNKKSKIQNPYIKSFETYFKMKDFAEEVQDLEILSRCGVVDRYKEKILKIVPEIKKAAVEVNKAEVVFTTAHKAKGLEFDNVKLLDDFPIVVKNKKLVDNKEIPNDEFNLMYVSVTRAKEKLKLSKNLEDFIDLNNKTVTAENNNKTGRSVRKRVKN